VTGFSNIEEKLAELDKEVPFLTENELAHGVVSTRRRKTRGHPSWLRTAA
jgi:hypothetical protein